MTSRATLTNAIENGIRNKLKGVNTAIPGYVLKFDPSTQLAELQISIERVDLNGNSEKWSPIIQCPVHFAGGKFVLEHQIDIGDEGLIIFSQRCIDAWVDQGGVAPQSRVQYHDMNDAMFIPGVRSQPKKITNFENNGIKLRNEDGSNFIHLKNDGTAEITITSLTINGQIIHNGNTNQTGNTTSTGTVTAPNVVGTTDVSFGGISGVNHVHGGVSTGTSNTGGPQ